MERDSPLLPTAAELPLSTRVTAAEGVATTKPWPKILLLHARGRGAMRQNASSPEFLSAAVARASSHRQICSHFWVLKSDPDAAATI